MRTIGLDVHDRFTEVAVLTDGRVTHRDRIQTVPAVLRAFAEGLRKDDQVALESTGVTWAVAEVLAEHAGRVVVSNPMRTKAIASAKVKTDKVDARVLAELLAADYLPEVWVPDGATRNLRRQISHRRSLVQERTRIRNRVHGVLHRNLVQSPCSDLFGKAGVAWLRDLQLASEERREVDSALRLLGFVDAEIDATEAEIATAVVDDRRVRHLLTIPGVGLMTAVALVAVVGDVYRFSRPNQLVGYLGLDPRVRQSGDRPAFTGQISRAGQAHATS